jgi:hypothetical protein
MNKIFKILDTRSGSYITNDELLINNKGEVFAVHPMDGELVKIEDCVVRFLTEDEELDQNKYYN